MFLKLLQQIASKAVAIRSFRIGREGGLLGKHGPLGPSAATKSYGARRKRGTVFMFVLGSMAPLSIFYLNGIQVALTIPRYENELPEEQYYFFPDRYVQKMPGDEVMDEVEDDDEEVDEEYEEDDENGEDECDI